jgi:hypothetical protein
VKRSKFTEQQIAFALKQAEIDTPVEGLTSGQSPALGASIPVYPEIRAMMGA